MKSTDKESSSSACKRSVCPIANALDIVGDKWTLLVVRDLFLGNSTYSELQQSPENIPTNILADRLKRLQQGGIVAKQSYQKKPVRYAYRLTDKGKDLGVILKAMVAWGNRHIPETYVPDEPDMMFQSIPDK